MYTTNDLAKFYFHHGRNGRLSSRLPDFGKILTLKSLNYALNSCEKWDNFLDIGASSGHYSNSLLSKFGKGTAVDIDKNKDLEKIARNNKNLKIKYGNFEDIPFSEKFDFITMIDIFEHFPAENISKIARKISTLQNNGGVIYLLTPNPIACGPAMASELFYLKNNIGYHGHYKHYTKTELQKIFSIYGYEELFYYYDSSSNNYWSSRILFGLSRRDANILNPTLIFFTAPLICLAKTIFKIYFHLIYLKSLKNRYDETGGKSLIIVLKKI